MPAGARDFETQGPYESQRFFGGIMNATQVFVQPVVRTILEQQHLGQSEDRHEGIDDVMTERHHDGSGFVRQLFARVAMLCHPRRSIGVAIRA